MFFSKFIKDKLNLQFAMPGYCKEGVSVSFDPKVGLISIKTGTSNESTYEKVYHYCVSGLKGKEFDTFSFENGLLSINFKNSIDSLVKII